MSKNELTMRNDTKIVEEACKQFPLSSVKATFSPTITEMTEEQKRVIIEKN